MSECTPFPEVVRAFVRVCAGAEPRCRRSQSAQRSSLTIIIVILIIISAFLSGLLFLNQLIRRLILGLAPRLRFYAARIDDTVVSDIVGRGPLFVCRARKVPGLHP